MLIAKLTFLPLRGGTKSIYSSLRNNEGRINKQPEEGWPEEGGTEGKVGEKTSIRDERFAFSHPLINLRIAVKFDRFSALNTLCDFSKRFRGYNSSFPSIRKNDRLRSLSLAIPLILIILVPFKSIMRQRDA